MIEIGGGDIDKSIRAVTWSKLIEKSVKEEFCDENILIYLCKYMKNQKKSIWSEKTFIDILHFCQYDDHYMPHNSINEYRYDDIVICLEFLINNDLIIFDTQKMLPFVLHSESIFELFKKLGVDLNENCSLNLFVSLNHKYQHCLGDLFKTNFDENYIGDNSQSLLHVAIKSNLFDETISILDKNPTILNQQNHKNQTILHLLCQGKMNEKKKIIFQKIKSKIDIELRNKSNKKAFECIQSRYLNEYPTWIISKKRERD